MPRNLLLVAYRFPPLGGSGVQRALKFAKYLPQHDWRVHVLTAGHSHYPLLDPTLAEEIDERIVVHRVAGWEPGGLAARIGGWTDRFALMTSARLPSPPSDESNGPTRSSLSAVRSPLQDRLYWRFERWASRLPLAEVESLWIGAALRTARNIIRASKIDAVLTTSPPYCVHRIGARLRRETGLPWIADLRDPIVDNFAADSTSSRDRAERERVEQSVLRHADQVVVTCDDLRVRLRSKCDAACAPDIDVIHNGFDAVDSPLPAIVCTGGDVPASVSVPASAQDSNIGSRFVLAHVGSFYRAQSIGPLLAAVRRLRTLRPDAADRFELRIVGSVSAAQKPLIRADDRSNVRVLGYLPHGDAIAAMARADALFLMTPAHSHGRYCIPAKTFEYLAFGGHIIALVHPASSLIDLLHNAGHATVVNHAVAEPDSRCGGVPPFDPEPLALAIARRFDAWESGEPAARRNAASLRCYQRQEQSRRLASLLNTVVKRCRGTAGDALPAPTAKRRSAKKKANRRVVARAKETS